MDANLLIDFLAKSPPFITFSGPRCGISLVLPSFYCLFHITDRFYVLEPKDGPEILWPRFSREMRIVRRLFLAFSSRECRRSSTLDLLLFDAALWLTRRRGSATPSGQRRRSPSSMKNDGFLLTGSCCSFPVGANQTNDTTMARDDFHCLFCCDRRDHQLLATVLLLLFISMDFCRR